MIEYLALLEQLHLPQLLIVVGAVLVLFGVVGTILGGARDVGVEASEAAPTRRENVRLSLPPPNEPTEW